MLRIQLITAFFISFIVNLLLILYFAGGGNIGQDRVDGGPQKFHIKRTSRVGGAGIFLAFTVAFLLVWVQIKDLSYIYLPIAALPVFAAGFIEDIMGKVPSKIRLIAVLLSAVLSVYFLNAYLIRVDIAPIDRLLSVKTVSVVFTLFAIAGLVNSFNIIDGFNGLSSAVSILILLSLGYISFKVGDILLMKVCIIMAFAIFGFFVWNYPFGKIFLGDGGSYFIGFVIAVASVLLVDANKRVSAWFPLLLCIYPIFETLFSIYRKSIRNTGAMSPDGFHLHMLIYKRVVPRIFGKDIKDNKLYQNSATSPILWLLTSFSVIPALLFWNNTFVLIIFTLLFVTVYVWLYKSIIGFKLGRFIKKR